MSLSTLGGCDAAAARASDALALTEMLRAAGCPVGVTAAQALAALAALLPAGDSEGSARSRVTGYHLGGGGGPDTFARAAGGDCTELSDAGAAAAAAADVLASAARARGGLSLAGSARPSGAVALASPSADAASDGASSSDSALLGGSGGGGGGAYAAVRAHVCALAAAGRLS